jgi:hypothetical protein
MIEVWLLGEHSLLFSIVLAKDPKLLCSPCLLVFRKWIVMINCRSVIEMNIHVKKEV